MNTALLFPGQASQYVGMGKDLYEKYDIAKFLYDRANELVDFDLKAISFEGPAEDLKQTKITQPAIFVHSTVLASLVNRHSIHFHAVAGHSLGEYSALVAAASMSFDDGLQTVALRGELMQSAGDVRPGTMAAVVGMNRDDLKSVCDTVSTDQEVVVPANFNAPGQIVISGDVTAVRKVMEKAKENGAKKVIALNVSGAFHSPLMSPAAEELGKHLESIELRPPKVPIYSNVTGKPEINTDVIRTLLIDQLTHPVLWEDTINNMVSNSFTKVIEVGPGKVLQGLVKRIDRSVEFQGMDTVDQAERFFTDENAG